MGAKKQKTKPCAVPWFWHAVTVMAVGRTSAAVVEAPANPQKSNKPGK
jgi:hypothetical protein